MDIPTENNEPPILGAQSNKRRKKSIVWDYFTIETVGTDCTRACCKQCKKSFAYISGSKLAGTNETRGYVFLTGQFVDLDWKLQRRILNIIMVPSPDSEVAFNHAVTRCLNDWGLDSKLFTLTLNESFANVTVRENLRGLLSIRNPLVLNGQLLIGNCYARVLTSLTQDALGPMKETIKKVRESVKYVKTSEFIEEKFIKLKQQLQVPSMKCLTIDNPTKWNTTYHMLVAALELKEVFSCLDTSDPNYSETPSMDEWKQLETLCAYLKLFFEAATILIATMHPTANLFFHE
ncbi:hypothetical protein C3L33_14565, partial [Rhododendron williamsianum]